MILPILASFLLSSCTSTVSSIDTTAASIQPQQEALVTAATADAGAIPLDANPTAPTLAMNGTDSPAAENVASASPVPQAAQVVIGGPATPDANQFTVASADTIQSEISAAAVGVKPAVDANPPVEATPPSAPQPVIATAEPVAGTQKLKAPEPTGQQIQLAASAAKVAPQTQELTNAAPAQQFLAPAPQAPAKKPRKTLFAAMFGDSGQKAPAIQKATVIQAAPAPLSVQTQLALASPRTKSAALAALTSEVETPQLALTNASIESGASLSQPNLENGDLPGVRKGALFEIKRRDSLDSDADVDIGETDSGPILLASAAGLGRLAPNGLKIQRESVDVACLKPQLVRMLKKLESHYGRPAVVTSGYRSPGYNRRVRGAKNSLHMYCAAADVQIPGVGKWELARFARSMPGRGGVGTYCHTESVHVDIGPDRDWNWRCSRRK